MVADDERLYRRVRADWAPLKDGARRISSQAFNDTGRKPSVDRASLRTSPDETKIDATDGVASLEARQVRGIDSVIVNPNAPPDDRRPYRVDVHPRPIPPFGDAGDVPNPAHAQIESDPAIDSGSRFNKLKDALTRIAAANGWVIPPTDPTPAANAQPVVPQPEQAAVPPPSSQPG